MRPTLTRQYLSFTRRRCFKFIARPGLNMMELEGPNKQTQARAHAAERQMVRVRMRAGPLGLECTRIVLVRVRVHMWN